MAHKRKGRKVALVTGLALVVLSVAMLWTYRKEIESWFAFRRDFESLGRNAQGYAEYQHRETGIVFVRLPGGTFEMGSPETESDRGETEGPVHTVRLSPFLIAKYEVSQAEWKKFMEANPSKFKGDALPVELVLWEDCKEFCAKTGLSLPTEAQWEYACRAGKAGPFAGTGKLDDMGWYRKNGGSRPHPVGEKQPNDFGLHDMHGNVLEWCEDVGDPAFYSKPEAAGPDPLCTSGSDRRILRGGSYVFSAELCRSAFRLRLLPIERGRMFGLRVAFYPAR